MSHGKDGKSHGKLWNFLRMNPVLVQYLIHSYISCFVTFSVMLYLPSYLLYCDNPDKSHAEHNISSVASFVNDSLVSKSANS